MGSGNLEDEAVGRGVSPFSSDAIFHLVCSPSVIFYDGRISINWPNDLAIYDIKVRSLRFA